MITIETLLELLTQYGGEIICTASLDVEQINQARASGRMYVNENSIGFVWMPDIKLLPTTEAEVEFFDKWFPLDVEMPEKFKTADFLFECGGAKCKIPNCKVCKNEMY